MFTRFAGLAALLVGAILTDIQVVRITLTPTANEPVAAAPARPVHLQEATPVDGVRVRQDQLPPRHDTAHP